MRKIAVFASGGGTDFQSIIDANERENFCVIQYLVASKPEIGAIARAEKHGIATLVYDKTRETKDAFYARVADVFKADGVELVVLAGWLSVVPESFIKQFENAILNIHPSLIPSFCGMGYYGLKVHQSAIDYGVKVSGATVHFVEADVDGGAIVAQRTVEVEDEDTAESLQKKVLTVEHQLLPYCVKKWCEGKIVKEGRRVRVLP